MFSMFMFYEPDIFRTSENGQNLDNFGKSKHFVNIYDELDSLIIFFSSDVQYVKVVFLSKTLGGDWHNAPPPTLILQKYVYNILLFS